MCGIVGYIGTEDVKETILNGLERLEYRGYDSAGIALFDGEEVKVFKDEGRIAHLREIIDYDISSTVGMGHTRWATHGKPNKINSHPHQCKEKRFTIVHNGIIENEEELKDKYLKNIELESETDTEVVAQILNKFTKEGEDINLALRHLMSEIEGSYALAILDSYNREKIYAAKNKSPLLIGKGDGFNMVGSDAMAMISHTNEFFELNDGEYVEISKDKVDIFNIYGVKVERDTYKAELDSDDIEKGTYPHYMLKEIDEQPFVIRRIIAEYQDEKG
ncbi:MAG TPA: glutamine--fructose-6-phosphate aminotransferase, partial [Clostridiales bacterium]|nr:glutamine--fructose-6-phosphate aminotransferase [Clostridiales bacterium]